MKYDAERLITDLLDLFKTNLNSRITKIQAEKQTLLGANNFDVPQIDDAAWFDALDDRVANFNPYIYYGLNDNTVIEIASAESSDLTAFFTVVLANDGNDPLISRKMLRYIRALQEISSRHFGDIAEASSLIVTTITPKDLKDLDTGTFHKIGGVAIKTAIS